jgi:hypothetical protein
MLRSYSNLNCINIFIIQGVASATLFESGSRTILLKAPVLGAANEINMSRLGWSFSGNPAWAASKMLGLSTQPTVVKSRSARRGKRDKNHPGVTSVIL